MRRRLIQTFIYLWLTMCVAVTAVWLAGRLASSPIPRPLTSRWSYQLNGPMAGSIGVVLFHNSASPIVGPPFAVSQTKSGSSIMPNLQYTPELLWWYDRQPTGKYYRFLGFGFSYDTNFEINSGWHDVNTGRRYNIGIPYWAAWVFFWLPVLILLPRWRRRQIRLHRRLKGQCVACGYDLRATPNRCPECGTQS